MFRNLSKLLQILIQAAPVAAKRLTIPTSLLLLDQPTLFSRSVFCKQSDSSLHNIITLLQDNIINILRNGDFVGYAYCFADNMLISTSYQLLQKTSNQRQNYQFYQGQNKIKGTFKIIGHFQNSTFIERFDSDTLKPLPGLHQREPFKISRIQIYLKKSYSSINNGYLVAQDAGFGIADGKGEIGSLILRNNKILGIVTHIGRDKQSGFLRFLQWKYFIKIVKYLKGHKMHLGVSAQALEDRQGISIVRIAPNSPFKNDLAMGDFITKVNGQKINSVQAFQRICILQESPLNLQILRQGGPQNVKVNIN